MKTITITPNYKALFERFLLDAKNNMLSLARPRTTHHGLAQIYTRSEVYAFVAALRVALGAMTDTGDLETLRAMIDKGAEAMFAQLNKEQEEENG